MMPSTMWVVPDPEPPRLTRSHARRAAAVTGVIGGALIGLAVGIYPGEGFAWVFLAGLMFGSISIDLLAQESDDA